METDGTRYAQISARLIKVSSNEESLAYQQEALTKLMTDNIGQAQNRIVQMFANRRHRGHKILGEQDDSNSPLAQNPR